MTVSVEVMTSVEGIEALRPEWESLEEDCDCRFYQRASYYLAYCAHLMPDNVHPYVVVFKNGGSVVGIFPWVIRTVSFMGLKVKIIGPIFHDHVYLSDVLIDKRHLHQIGLAFDRLTKQLPMNHMVRAYGIPVDGHYAAMHFLGGTSKSFFYELASSYYLALNGTVDVDEKLPKRIVKNIKRLKRKAAGQGECQFEFLTGNDITTEKLESFFELEASGWKGPTGAGTAIKLHPELVRYYRDLVARMADKMQLNLYYLDQKLIAGHYCFKDEGCLSLAKVTYAEEEKALSPGHVLIHEAIDHAHNGDGIDTISFITDAGWLGKWHPLPLKTFIIYTPGSRLGSIGFQLFNVSLFIKRKLWGLKRRHAYTTGEV